MLDYALPDLDAPDSTSIDDQAGTYPAREAIDYEELKKDIDDALRLRRSITNASSRRIRLYAGSCYRADWTSLPGAAEVIETHAYEWCVTVVPHLVIDNPTVKVTEMGITDAQTQSLQLALQSLIRQIKLSDTLRAVGMDLQFDFGVAMVRLEPTPGIKGPEDGAVDAPQTFVPMRPVVERVSPRMYFHDAQTPIHGKPRFAGHFRCVEIDELLAETTVDQSGNVVPRYNPELIKNAAKSADLEQLRVEMLQDGIVLTDERKNVLLVEVWLRKQNQLVTCIWNGATMEELEEPRSYAGPEEGPYVLFGLQSVPDQVYPLAPLAVVEKQVEELSAHRMQAAKSAAVAKTVHVFDGAAEGQIAQFMSCADGSGLSLPNFTGKYATVRTPGADPQTLEYIDRCKARLNETSGINDVMRGNISGEASATEVAQAGGFADVRLKDAQHEFKNCVGELLRRIVDLLDRHDDVIFPVAAEHPVTGEMTRATFVGGADEDPMNAGWPFRRSLTVTIEPYSMEYTSQAVLRQQMMTAQEYIIKITQAGTMMPWLKVEKMITDLMAQFNLPNAGSRYVDFALMRQAALFAQLMGAGGGDPAATGGAGGGTQGGVGKQPSASPAVSPGQIAASNVPRPSVTQGR